MDEQAETDLGSSVDLRKSVVRVGLLIVVTVAIFVAAHLTGFDAHFKPKEVQERMAAVGVWGPIAYLVAFSVGELVHLPGTVFVAAAVVAYGRVLGTSLAYVGAVVSLSASFVVVRSIGGQPLGVIRWAFVRRILRHLDDRPVRTVILLRTLLWLTPQLNYALALSRIRFRSYLIGSAVGLIVPVICLGFAIDYFVH